MKTKTIVMTHANNAELQDKDLNDTLDEDQILLEATYTLISPGTEGAMYRDQFWATLDRVVRGFQGGEELQYKDSIILVREKPTDELKIRYKGLNLSHRLNQLPPGIVMAIANHGFDETQPVNQVLKGAFLVVHPTSSEAMIADARRWWEEAANNDVEIGDLTKVIDDDYLLKSPTPTE